MSIIFYAKFEIILICDSKLSRLKKNSATYVLSLHGFNFVDVTVVKIASRSFSSVEIQHFRTEYTGTDYN
jgi:hypothetical protein